MLKPRHFFHFLVAFILVRGLLSSWIPLMEFTEARYAEVTRRILADGDWISLSFIGDQPFWAKPPLAFWSVALSFIVFGMNEFAARLPSLIYLLLSAWMMVDWAGRSGSGELRFSIGLVFLSMLIVMQASGSILTDPLLTLVCILIMRSFWELMMHDSWRWFFALWIALGLGLLTKGPVVPVLCGLACGGWLLLKGDLMLFLRRVRVIRGCLVMVIIAAPWYLAAEKATPGFIDYFIVGEHYLRYTQSEWAGDKYGAVKDMPLFTVWLYLLIGAFPWSFIVLGGIAGKIKGRIAGDIIADMRGLSSFDVYLISWIFMPILFFSFAKNVIPTYVMPAIPALSFLAAKHFNPGAKKLLMIASANLIAFGILSALIFSFYFEGHRYNQRPVIDKYQALSKKAPGPIFYSDHELFSVLFYLNGQVKFGRGLWEFFENPGNLYVAERDRWLESTQYRLEKSCSLEFRHDDVSLWFCPAVDSPRP
ncbi:MAG: glycosyltransferase family 39 protein [Pseudomonadales bacterium]|nr:glycosyltransferase family 39 protein [Pseudomonadales bacterium]